MELSLIYQGALSSIYAIVLNNGDCPSQDFLNYLERNDKASYKALAHIMVRHAEYGVLRNRRNQKSLQVGEICSNLKHEMETD